MHNNETILKILQLFDENYPDKIRCYLDYENEWQLLVATILSAQCTDNRVNIVTKDLFKKYLSIRDFADADIKELELDIKSTGFYRNKAKHIKNCCTELIRDYKEKMPSDINELVKLSGVGRKTANVIRGNIYNIESIVVDTHVKRISKKLGLTESEDPVKIEFDLMKVLPKDRWIRYNTQIIAHGRTLCKARKPKCEECFLLEYCQWGKNHKTK